jgi:hypothetical protein
VVTRLNSSTPGLSACRSWIASTRNKRRAKRPRRWRHWRRRSVRRTRSHSLSANSTGESSHASRISEKHMFVPHRLFFARNVDGIDSIATGHWTVEFRRLFLCLFARRSKHEDIQQRYRGSVAANARTVPGHAASRQSDRSERIPGQQTAGTLSRCGVGRATIRVRR